MRHLALLALLGATFATATAAARFGDRLAPRVPAPYSPRAAPSSNLHDEYDEETTEEEYEQSQEYEVEIPQKQSKTEAHRLEMSTEFFLIPSKSLDAAMKTQKPYTTSTQPLSTTTVRTSTTTIVSPQPSPAPHTGALRTEPWAVPVLAVACSCMLAVIGFEIYFVWGAKRSMTSRRRPLLARTLLAGLFMCAITAAIAAATPTPFTCGVIRFGSGASYAIVFASLLVECVYLMSVDGGVYLPTAYQALLLFFAVTIQIAIGAQWLGSTPPRVEDGLCATPPKDLLLSLTYCALLVCATCGAAVRARGVRDSGRAARRAGGAAGVCAAAWLCWGIGALAAPPRHRDACIAGGLLATCAIVFAAKFARGKRAVTSAGVRYDAERDDGLSSLGAAGSGYSPSFFHFKPVKYGIVTSMSMPMGERKELPPTTLQHQAADGVVSPWHYYSQHPFMHYYHYSPYHYYMPQPGVLLRSDDGNMYTTTVEPTFSSNPNVYFHRTESHSGVHPGMMY